MNALESSSPFYEALYIAIFIFAIISFILGMSIIVLSLTVRSKISFTFSLILNIIFSSMIHTISYTFSWKEISESFLCNFQSILLIASSLSEELWVTIVTIQSYISTKEMEKESTMKWSQLLLLYLLGYLFPITIALLYFCLDLLGQNDLNCWLKKKYYYQGLGLYCHKWINIIIVLIFSYKMLRLIDMTQIKDEKEKKKAKHYILNILMFPAIQIFGGLVPTIYTILIGAKVDTYILNTLGIITLIVGSLQGVFFPLAYICIQNVRRNLFKCFYPAESSQAPENDDNISFGSSNDGNSSFDQGNNFLDKLEFGNKSNDS